MFAGCEDPTKLKKKINQNISKRNNITNQQKAQI